MWFDLLHHYRDFTGALYVCHDSTETKAYNYICLFICTTSWAIHLEIVTDLMVDTLVLAFRRFTVKNHCVRQCILPIWAAADGLQQLEIIEVLGRQGVLWNFITKRAPWYSEWWEHLISLIKIPWQIKSYLTSSAESSSRSRGHPQLSTTDMCLPWAWRSKTFDSSPVATWSLNYVTPTWGSGRTRPWKIQPLLIPRMWIYRYNYKHSSLASFTHDRDINMYLTSFREFHWTSGTNRQQIKPGGIVLVHDDSHKITWRLAVIEELKKGKDGLVCAAKIRTAHGRTNHPIDITGSFFSSDHKSSKDVASNSGIGIQTSPNGVSTR